MAVGVYEAVRELNLVNDVIIATFIMMSIPRILWPMGHLEKLRGFSYHSHVQREVNYVATINKAWYEALDFAHKGLAGACRQMHFVHLEVNVTAPKLPMLSLVRFLALNFEDKSTFVLFPLSIPTKLKYLHSYWNAEVEIQKITSMNNHIPCNLPTLDIQFQFDTLFPGRSVEQEAKAHSKSLHLKLFHSITYMSYKWGEAFDKNYRRFFIHNMIEEVYKIIHDECNKGRQRLNVSIRMILVVPDMLQLLQKMENDENNAMNHHDSCVICLEKLGKEKERMCMPCSHIFHKDCITTWLQNGHSCPVSRYDLRVT
ncbi:uncharacterized protein LOC129885216 [Solanum dulcamara]|uniref:uncharacterized protein LOC129885216 n=1 Tax=Solanum dulcamara TaxID=45834 RepID=UPI002485AE06|nr:uncharacterized protein LOC129885216 [Solanum dulcamara]